MNKTPDYVTYANQIIKMFAEEMEREHEIFCVGDSGSMPEFINDIGIEFQLFRRATIEEARALEVFAVERLTEMINSHEKIRPYLCEFPFPPSRVEVCLSFCLPSGISFADGTIARVTQIRGNVRYLSTTPESFHYTTLLKEPYLEAKKIVEASPNTNPFIHQEKPHEPLIDAVLATYLREMFKDYRFELDGIGGKLVDGVEEVVVRLICFQPTNLEKARELQIIATERLLYLINSNEKLRPYIKDYPLTLNNLKVSVLFRKKNYFPYFNGSMERASQEGDQICYYQEIPEDKNSKVFVSRPRETPLYAKESYQDALSKVEGSRAFKKMKAKCSSL
ncbi:MAG: hypothetical protein KF898_01940 [Parachlamydiales bacterium]|nr:hypothetical protein [Candidatus Acheromyda pituitae]